MSKFFAGIDLGSMNSAAVGSTAERASVPTTMGWAKDELARMLVGDSILLGEELEQNRMALEVVRPLRDGAIKFSSLTEDEEEVAHCRDNEAIVFLLKRLLQQINLPLSDETRCIVGVPSKASMQNRRTVLSLVQQVVPTVALVPEPFAVAFGLYPEICHALIIDIGAGTTDLCHYYGAFPTADDQITIKTGGDRLDQSLLEAIETCYPECVLNLDLVRQLKEKHGSVGLANSAVVVSLPTKSAGVEEFDITEVLQKHCQQFANEIGRAAVELIERINFGYRQETLGNIVLAGGGSCLKGLDTFVENVCRDFGTCNVTRIHDSRFAGADGALRLAMKLPEAGWQQLTQGNHDSVPKHEIDASDQKAA
jgi:rod shape-determining protein MreB and related proteins